MKYLMGIDNGGTVTKAAIFNLHGTEISVAARPVPLLTPEPGWNERDMEALWEANCGCIRDCLHHAGLCGKDIAGVAVGGHGKGLYAWGKDNRPAYNGILSTDNRAWRFPEIWRKTGVFDRLYPQLCQQLLPGQPAALLAWMKEMLPAVYHNIRWVFSAKDYIRFRLTGEAFCETTDLSGSGLLDVRDRRVDPQILETLGIGEAAHMLAPMRNSFDRCGAVTAEVAAATGLAAGTPVAGGMFDIDACAIAMDMTTDEELCSITGTWTINEFISEQPILHREIAMNSLYAIPGYYLVEESSPTGAGNLEWILDNLLEGVGSKERYRLADQMVEEVSPEKSAVIYLPFLYGSNAHALGKASFVGISNSYTKADLLRAVYEGSAFTARVHIDRLLAVRHAPSCIRMAGGAVNSPVWVQMYADILGFPIETVSSVRELGALGCAMAASIAAGIYPDYRQAARQMVHISPPVHPDPARHRLYCDKYKLYQEAMRALNPYWKRAAEWGKHV